MTEEPMMELDELVYNEKVMAPSWAITQLAIAQVYRHYDTKE